MKNYKNYLIALLTGLLVLSLTTSTSQGASSSTKLIQYDRCLAYMSDHSTGPANVDINFGLFVDMCKKYK